MTHCLRLLLSALCWISLPACKRERMPFEPKAVPVRLDGALELDLMSFNVRYENPEDPGARAWPRRIAGAVRMIRTRQPDVFGVQEALHGQAADLRASLPDYGFAGNGRDDGKRSGEYSAIFFRRDRFEPDPVESGTFWLSDTPETPGSNTWGNEIPRLATWLRLIDRSTGRGFLVFNTHWDHRNQASRERAAILIAERIDQRRHAGEPVVLLGDFNSIETNPGILYLTGMSAPLAGTPRIWNNGLLDTFQTLHPQRKDRRTLHLWRNSTEGNLKLDHIFVSRGARILEAEILSQEMPPVSDHFPVTARVVFPSE